MTTKQQILTRAIIITVLIIIFAGYGFYEAKCFLTGPKIELVSPAKGTELEKSDIEIKGKASNISLLYLNGRQIFTDTNGDFKENILLAKGNNIIEVSAKDKFGREINKLLEVVLK